METQIKPDFRSLHLHTLHPSERKRSRAVSFSKDFFEDDSE